MQIRIHDELPVSAAVEAFSAMFPFLRLELYLLPDGIAGRRPIHTQQTFRIFRKNDVARDGFIIRPGMTVEELDQCFRNEYGITAQVLRKAGSIWLKATVTDQWTLEEQNRLGDTISGQLRPRRD